MATKEELLRVPAFADLPEEQIEWFLTHSEELLIKPGDAYIEEGAPADAMFVLLEGQLHARGDLGGQNVVFTFEPGDVGGRLPFSRMKIFTFTRARGTWKAGYCVSRRLSFRNWCSTCRSWPAVWSA